MAESGKFWWQGWGRNAKKGLGPSINISTMAWNFEVNFGTQPYLRSRNSCTKVSQFWGGWWHDHFSWHRMTPQEILWPIVLQHGQLLINFHAIWSILGACCPHKHIAGFTVCLLIFEVGLYPWYVFEYFGLFFNLLIFSWPVFEQIWYLAKQYLLFQLIKHLVYFSMPWVLYKASFNVLFI